MKFIFKYGKFLNNYEPYCESVNHNDEEEFLASYLIDSDIRLAKYAIEKLENKNIINDFIDSEGWDVDIMGDKVMIELSNNNYEDKIYIDRKIVAYAVSRWLKFLERDMDINYEEIIDTEDMYKE
jgi:hypothetical protein